MISLDKDDYDQITAFACFLRDLGENTVNCYNYNGGYYDAIPIDEVIAVFVDHKVVFARNNKEMTNTELEDIFNKLEHSLWLLIQARYKQWGWWVDQEIDKKIATIGGVWRHRYTGELVLTLGARGRVVRFMTQNGNIKELASWNNGYFPMTYRWVGEALDIVNRAIST